MTGKKIGELPVRERQVLEAVIRLGQASVADVMDALPDPPSNGATRSVLRILREKGLVRVERDGKRYIYSASLPRRSAARTLRETVQTFFNGSLTDAVSTLIDNSTDPEELREVERLVREARRGMK